MKLCLNIPSASCFLSGSIPIRRHIGSRIRSRVSLDLIVAYLDEAFFILRYSFKFVISYLVNAVFRLATTSLNSSDVSQLRRESGIWVCTRRRYWSFKEEFSSKKALMK